MGTINLLQTLVMRGLITKSDVDAFEISITEILENTRDGASFATTELSARLSETFLTMLAQIRALLTGDDIHHGDCMLKATDQYTAREWGGRLLNCPVIDKAIISAMNLQEVWKELLASGVPPDVAREMIDELRPTVRPHDASAAWASAQLGPFAPLACSSET